MGERFYWAEALAIAASNLSANLETLNVNERGFQRSREFEDRLLACLGRIEDKLDEIGSRLEVGEDGEREERL